jgi:hypothetical protein
MIWFITIGFVFYFIVTGIVLALEFHVPSDTWMHGVAHFCVGWFLVPAMFLHKWLKL